MDSPPVPLLAFSAYSGSGKTTLLERVVPELRKIGLRIAIIKHTHHRVDLDQPGKDSYRLREAGANPVMIASKKRWALLFESGPDQDEPQLSALVAQLDPAMFDLVLVEGFKEQPVAKIEIIRQGVEKSALHPKDSSFIAVASDLPDLESSLPVLDLNNPTAIANFISAWMREYPMSQTDRKKAPVSSQVEARNRALLPVATALQQIRAAITPIRGRILCHLKEAYGHIVAGDIGSPIAVPGYDNSAMDGYAFHADDLPGAAPKTLRLVGSSLAGAPFAGSIKPGEAIRITTGAATPDGCGFVVMQEQVVIDGDQITIEPGHRLAAHIRRAGEDIAQGGVVVGRGQRIGAAELGLLASLGISEIEVVRPLRIATLSTGDELCSPGQRLADGQIYDSNRYALYGLIKELGATQIDMGIIPDRREAVSSAFAEAAQIADVVITSGGVSVGDADYVKETLERMGTVNFWQIAMKPGKPLAYGKIGEAWLFGLPGNPVSSMATFIEIVRPSLQYMAGQLAGERLRLKARSLDRLIKRPGRADFQRGILSYQGDELVVRSTGDQGSHILSSMSRANCFITLAAEADSVAVGETVTVEPFNINI